MRRLEQLGIVLGVLLLVALPTALHGWPTTLRGNVFLLLMLAGGLALVWWRTQPRAASVVALGLILAALAVGGGWFPDVGVTIFSASFAVLALGWSGRAAWLVALCGLAYLVPFYYLAEVNSWVATVMFTVPPYVAGTVLRLRRETQTSWPSGRRSSRRSGSCSGRSPCATSGRGSPASCTTSSVTPSA